MHELEQMSLFAIAAGAVASMALGALWYSPLLFGNVWLAAIGKTQEQLGSPTPAMLGSMLSCLVTAAVVEFIVTGMGATSLFMGALLGACLGFGVVAMAMLSDSLFCGWGTRLYFIQAGYRVAYLVLMACVSGAWPR